MSQNLFQWKHFESEIILLCVRWYLKYPPSYRMLVEMMQERGLNLTHTTIMRWVHQYSPVIYEKLRKHVKSTNNSWRMDETYLKIKPMLGFDSFKTTKKTICGIEIMHMIRKGQVKEIQSTLYEVQFIKKIMGTPLNTGVNFRIFLTSYFLHQNRLLLDFY